MVIAAKPRHGGGVFLAPAIVLLGILQSNVLIEGQVITTNSIKSDSFTYYDVLRENPSGLGSIEFSEESNVIGVEVNDESTGESVDLRLAEMKVFLAFSNETHSFVNSHNDAGAVLLAQYHFNNMNLLSSSSYNDILPEEVANDIRNCNVRLTSELLDSQYSPIASTRVFTEVLQEDHVLERPRPAGVVGACRSATASPLAVLTGVNGIVQVSASATSTDFDVKEQFPLFGRTITSAAGEAKSALDFFLSIGAEYVGVLYITDAYGSSLQKAFQDAANEAGITTDSVAFSFSSAPGGREIDNAMSHLKRTEFRLFYAICFEAQFRTVISAAEEHGIIGPDFLWTFPGVTARSFNTIDLSGLPAKALRGIGLFQIQGGITYEHILPNGETEIQVADEDQTASGGGFENFRAAWREASKDQVFTDYVRSKLPARLSGVEGFDPSAPFSVDIFPFMPLLYDAVIGVGLSMCRAGSHPNHTFFTGDQVYQHFRNLDFEGASGRVFIFNETGTRFYHSLTFMLWNTQEHSVDEETGETLFKLVPTGVYRNSSWQQVSETPFIYSDGTDVPPKSLPPVNEKFNYIGNTGRATGFVLMGFVMFLCLVSVVWMIVYREKHVVVSAQPLFLVMVSAGSFIMAATIIPLSYEELVTDNIDNLDQACMASPWLYILGSVITLSALLAKTRGVHKAYLYPELDFIHVTSFDIFSTFAVISICNAIVLLVWTFREPLEWTRTYKDATDQFNRSVESFGSCTNENSFPFVIVILVMNVLILILGNWWAYQSRNIETEYLESRYISISMAAVLQAWCMGIPILIVVWDTPQAKFFVETGIIFVTALAFLALIYIPKVIAVIQDHKKAIEEEKKRAFTNFTERAKKQEEQYENKSPMDDDDDSEGTSTDGKEEAITHEPAPRIEPSRSSNKISEETTKTSFAEAHADEQGGTNRFKFSGAMKSSSHGQSVNGIKVTHNPRSEKNLTITNGREMSKEQLAQYQKSGVNNKTVDNPPDVPEEVPESAAEGKEPSEAQQPLSE